MSKSNAIIEWVRQNVLPILLDAQKQQIEGLIDELKQLPTSLPANTLSLNDAIAIFDLSYNELFDAWPLADHKLCEIPALLVAIKKEYAFVIKGSVANEAFTRSQIDDILIICIGEEKRLALQEYNEPSPAPLTQLSTRPQTPSPDPAPLILQFETKLNRLVTFKGQKRIIQGIADYSLWYNKDEQMAINLILVEAKRQGELSKASGQLVAYMGIVHRTRESQGKRNKLVYGLSTDGDEFQFWRLDNSSELTRSRKINWNGGDGARIVSYIRLIIRSAIRSSPSTSPIKDQERRDVSLSVYRDPEKAKSFDYGGKRFTLPDDNDDDDNDDDNDDLNFIDLSSLQLPS